MSPKNRISHKIMSKTPNHYRPASKCMIFFLNNRNQKEFTIQKQIGKGSFANVFIAHDKKRNKMVVFKIYRYSEVSKTKLSIENLYNEMRMLHQLNHKNIIKLISAIDDHKKFILIMELFSNISLYRYLESMPNKQVPEEKARYIFR